MRGKLKETMEKIVEGGRKGGNKTKKRYGKKHFKELIKKRWDKKDEVEDNWDFKSSRIESQRENDIN